MTGQDAGLRDAAAFIAAWNAVLPADVVVPLGFAEGVLTIGCRSYAWMTLVKAMAGNLQNKFNETLPSPAIRKIETTPVPVRVLVTGSRTWNNITTVDDALLDTWHDTIQLYGPHALMQVVHGACPSGADSHAAAWVTRQDGQLVSAEAHPADWEAHGRVAGPRRNAAMVSAGADICLAFIHNGSRGASHTAALAEKAAIPTRRFTA
jgi:hypothetical protein